MITRMKLPAGEPIDCHDLAWAVAKYRFPFPEEGATGISCITGSKLVEYSRAAIPSTRFIKKPRTLLAQPPKTFDPLPAVITGQRLVRPEMLIDLCLPVKLTEQEQVLLAAILDELPPLKYPMSAIEHQNFLAAFRQKLGSLQLVGERRWEPILATETYVDRQRCSQIEFFAKNGMVALGEEFARGHLNILNRSGNPALTFDPKLDLGHYFLTRREVICNLNRLKIPCTDCDSTQGTDIIPRDAEFDGGQGKDDKKWTLDRVREMHADYMLSRDGVKAVANRRKLSVAMMYRRFDEYNLGKKTSSGRKSKEKTNLNGIMSKWVKPAS